MSPEKSPFFEEEFRIISPPTVNLHFSAQDTDVGISPEKMETIFLPFKHTGLQSRRAEGTGC
ncbi:MAG: hypothetical protein QNJ68_16315 [Microcoleaceae cyanobacterium MO_207.B10]|nr:hypothetical protein [Microcoleaceae cyanobacterium MO_207.B10]